jgi:hypothetical protein
MALIYGLLLETDACDVITTGLDLATSILSDPRALSRCRPG